MTADKYLSPTENKCKMTKAKVTKLRRASYKDGMADRRTHADFCRDYASVK